jgi:hypothetical protein
VTRLLTTLRTWLRPLVNLSLVMVNFMLGTPWKIGGVVGETTPIKEGCAVARRNYQKARGRARVNCPSAGSLLAPTPVILRPPYDAPPQSDLVAAKPLDP